MNQEPESLEETQRRLAGYGPSPYGPNAAAENTAHENAAVEIPAGEPRFDEAPVESKSTRSPLVVLALAGLLAVGGVGAGVALFGGGIGGPDWTAYPGSAYRSVPEVLASDSLEVVVANGDAFVADYKQALTDEFGFTWTETSPALTQPDINGYGGDSLLQSYNSATWQAAITLNDPAARQEVSDIFAEVAAAHASDDAYSQNDYETIDDAEARERFGAAEKPDQAYWTLSAVRYQPHNVRFWSDVYDRNLPTDESFTGEYWFTIADGDPNTFYVTVYVTGYALLSEEDRDTFIEAVQPYEGSTPPDL